MNQNTKVVVVGGGYAGVLAANRLTQRDDVDVTLINPRPHFVQRIRLHQLVAGTADPVVGYEEVLADRVGLTVDAVTRIDAAGRSLALKSGDSVAYDYLIYAVGSASAAPQVPGAADFAFPVATLEQAQRLRSALDAAPEAAAVVVVGAGPSGIETAAELAEQGRTVTLACGGELGPYLHPSVRRSVAKRLAGLGVAVLDGPESKVVSVERDAVRLSGGHRLSSAVTIWTAGFGVPDLAARSGLSTDADGRLLTDETLTSVDDERIVAAGDSAAPSGLPFRMSCQAAMQLGPGAADTVLSRIAGERPAVPKVALAALCVSLGRRAGIYQFASFDDAAKRLYIGGRAGAKVKEYICSHILNMLAGEARKPGSLTWRFQGSERRRTLEVAGGQDRPQRRAVEA